MAYEHKPGSGSIFKNDRKEASNHPDYTGIMKGLDGKMYRVIGRRSIFGGIVWDDIEIGLLNAPFPPPFYT